MSKLTSWSKWSNWLALMIRLQKIFGLYGVNYQIIEKSWDVKPVTEIQTESGQGVGLRLSRKLKMSHL